MRFRCFVYDNDVHSPNAFCIPSALLHFTHRVTTSRMLMSITCQCGRGLRYRLYGLPLQAAWRRHATRFRIVNVRNLVLWFESIAFVVSETIYSSHRRTCPVHRLSVINQIICQRVYFFSNILPRPRGKRLLFNKNSCNIIAISKRILLQLVYHVEQRFERDVRS
jgi:hypothetical protein